MRGMPTITEADARAALDRIDGLTWSAFAREDLPEIARFYGVCEDHDHNPERWSLAELQEFWDSPRSRPDEDTLVARAADGQVVATAWAGCNRDVTERRGVFCGGSVRPDYRGRGIGDAVLRWQLAHGVEWDAATRQEGYGPLVMRLFAPVDQSDVRELAERHGMPVERYFFEMGRDLGELPQRPVVDGIRIAPWSPECSREVHRVVNEAFRDHWGHVDSTEQMWDEMIRSSTFRPEWSLLAIDEDSGRVVGAAINAAYEQDWAATGVKEGYTDELGVLRSHRGRGIAGALLRESMHRFAQEGMQEAGLGVDAANPTGALRLYEGLGYRRTSSTCAHTWTSEAR